MARSTQRDWLSIRRFASRPRDPRRRNGTRQFQRRLRIEPLEDRRLLATFMVDSLNDAGAGSLRQAILDANGMAGADTIEFDSVAGTIALTTGEMEITEALAIDGPGDEVLTIDAQENSRILNISAVTGDFTINGLTLTGGSTTADNPTLYDSTYNGGAIRSLTTGNLTITNSTVSGNRTAGIYADGGGIFGYGNVTITNSTISGNHSAGYAAQGGGVYGFSNVTLTNSTVSGNRTAGDYAQGGGVGAYGNVTLTNSTVSGNSTAGEYAAGGGVWAYGNLTLTGSTVSENHTLGESAGGGGVSSYGDVTLNNSTVSGNHTEGENGSGGGIHSSGDVTLSNSTVSGNHTLGSTAVGGGIFSTGNVTLTISTVRDNYTAGYAASGGAIRANSSVTLTNSTVSGNHTAGLGATGGGVWAYENVTLTNSTVSGNHTGGDYAWGGGSFSYGNLTLTNSTISGNHTAGVFANGAGAMVGEYGALTMSNSILAGNTAVDGRPDLWLIGSVPPNLHFSLVGNNFGALLLVPAPLGSPDSNGNLIGTAVSPIDPKLGPLADNGGPTLPDASKILTQAPLPGSPALDAGNPTIVFNPAEFDQRGAPYVRVVNGDGIGGARIDMGAVESQPIITPPALLGDYNRDNSVDAADYVMWRNTLGTAGLTPYQGADGSGNGAIGPEDNAIWRAHFGQSLPLGAASGSIAAVAVTELVAPSVSLVASDRVASDQQLSASDGDPGRFISASQFALDAHARPTIRPRFGASLAVDPSGAVAARQDRALLAWVASSTSAELEVGSTDLYHTSTRSTIESLDDLGLGVLDAAFGMLNGQKMNH